MMYNETCCWRYSQMRKLIKHRHMFSKDFIFMSHIITKISIVSFMLLGNTSLLSMKCNTKLALIKKSTIKQECDNSELAKAFEFGDAVYNQYQTHIPTELIVGVGAYTDDTFKGALKETCKYFNSIVSSHNVNFVSHPLFKTSESKLHRMVLYNSWYNNKAIVDALRKHVRNDIIVIPSFTECDAHGTGVYVGNKEIAIDLPGQLNKKYSNLSSSELLPLQVKPDIDLAMYCAALCDDTQAIKNLVPQVVSQYGTAHEYGRAAVQKSLMLLLAKRANKEAFEFMIINDPYRIREYHHSLTKFDMGQPYHEDTLLEDLKQLDNMDEYIKICKDHGEKANKDIVPACIIL